jgi:RNA recognition motif-containing protein
MTQHIDHEAGICVIGVGEGCTDELLRDAFSSYGTIVDIFIKPPTYNRRRGFAFVTFENKGSVPGALAAAVTKIGEDEVTVEGRTAPKPRREATASRSIYIKGLDESTGQEVVEAAAGAFGAVTSIDVSADRGFAFVEFELVEDAQKAVDAQPLSIAGAFCDVEFRMSTPRNRKGKKSSARVADKDGNGRGGGNRAEGGEKRTRERAPREANSVYLKGVPADCSDADIQAALAGFGACISASHRDGRNFAFAVFDSEAAMESAVSTGACQVGGEEVSIEARN